MVTRKVMGHLFPELAPEHGVEISIRGVRESLRWHAWFQSFSLNNTINVPDHTLAGGKLQMDDKCKAQPRQK